MPVGTDYDRRQAMKNAAAKAGFAILEVLQQSKAAAIAYGLDEWDKYRFPYNRKVLVLNLGGSFESALFLCRDDGLQTLATVSDIKLGGKDFDQKLVTHFVDDLRRSCGFVHTALFIIARH